MQKSLCLDTLGDLDGGSARAIINVAIREMLADLDDRGDDEKERQVAITLKAKMLENGLVEMSVEAAARLPRRRTPSTIAKIKRDHKGGGQQSRLLFQDGAPDDPNQRTIDEVSNGSGN